MNGPLLTGILAVAVIVLVAVVVGLIKADRYLAERMDD